LAKNIAMKINPNPAKGVLLTLLVAFFALSGHAQQKTFIDPYPAGYSAAVVSEGGRTIQVSGVTARDASGKAKGNLRLQTEQVYEQIGQVLQKAGATFADIVKMNIYVVNYRPEDLPMIREVRARFLDQQRPPASTLVGVQALFGPDVLIEVDVVAVAK
jgi:enamine deaminase RidA (YjgF/YER057c/UK114 family)